MGKPRSPLKPVYSHHRLMKQLLTVSDGEDHSPTPGELDRVARGFQRCGGSWVKLHQGSVDDMDLLRKLLKVAAKNGLLTKSSKWGA